MLEALPDRGGEAQIEKVEALIGLFRALAAATHAHGYIPHPRHPEVSLRAVMGNPLDPEPAS